MYNFNCSLYIWVEFERLFFLNQLVVFEFEFAFESSNDLYWNWTGIMSVSIYKRKSTMIKVSVLVLSSESEKLSSGQLMGNLPRANPAWETDKVRNGDYLAICLWESCQYWRHTIDRIACGHKSPWWQGVSVWVPVLWNFVRFFPSHMRM